MIYWRMLYNQMGLVLDVQAERQPPFPRCETRPVLSVLLDTGVIVSVQLTEISVVSRVE